MGFFLFVCLVILFCFYILYHVPPPVYVGFKEVNKNVKLMMIATITNLIVRLNPK